MDRRDFIKGAGVAAVGIAVSVSSLPPPKKEVFEVAKDILWPDANSAEFRFILYNDGEQTFKSDLLKAPMTMEENGVIAVGRVGDEEAALSYVFEAKKKDIEFNEVKVGLDSMPSFELNLTFPPPERILVQKGNYLTLQFDKNGIFRLEA